MPNADYLSKSHVPPNVLIFSMSERHIRREQLLFGLLALVFVPMIWAGLYFAVNNLLLRFGADFGNLLVAASGATALVVYIAIVLKRPAYHWPPDMNAKAAAKKALHIHYRRMIAVNIALAVCFAIPAAWCFYAWNFAADFLWAIVFFGASLSATVGIFRNLRELRSLRVRDRS